MLVQTRSPGHHVIRHVAGHDTDAFLAEELGQRRSPPYPPHVGLVNLLVSAPEELKAADGAAELAAWCLRLIERRELPLMLLGPAVHRVGDYQRRVRAGARAITPAEHLRGDGDRVQDEELGRGRKGAGRRGRL